MERLSFHVVAPRRVLFTVSIGPATSIPQIKETYECPGCCARTKSCPILLHEQDLSISLRWAARYFGRKRPMFVTNHVLSGVVIGRFLRRRPVTAFVVGVGSHLVLDMVPHWGCDFRTAENRKLFLRYARRDGLLGLLVMACAAGAVDRGARKATIAAMAGAALLDADKPMMFYFGRNPFPRVVRKIHGRAQNESPEGLPNEILFGLSSALVDAVFVANARRRYASES